MLDSITTVVSRVTRVYTAPRRENTTLRKGFVLSSHRRYFHYMQLQSRCVINDESFRSTPSQMISPYHQIKNTAGELLPNLPAAG